MPEIDLSNILRAKLPGFEFHFIKDAEPKHIAQAGRWNHEMWGGIRQDEDPRAITARLSNQNNTNTIPCAVMLYKGDELVGGFSLMKPYAELPADCKTDHCAMLNYVYIAERHRKTALTIKNKPMTLGNVLALAASNLAFMMGYNKLVGFTVHPKLNAWYLAMGARQHAAKVSILNRAVTVFTYTPKFAPELSPPSSNSYRFFANATPFIGKRKPKTENATTMQANNNDHKKRKPAPSGAMAPL